MATGRKTSSKLKRIAIVIAYFVGVIWVIYQGGFNAGRMKGLIVISVVLLVYLVAKDARQYKEKNRTWLRAISLSVKNNISFLLK